MPRKPVIENILRRRVAVNFLDSDAIFIGRLADYDSETYVFDQCETHPPRGETPQPIKGRQYVDRIHCWLSEL